MTIETQIKDIERQGVPDKVLSDYKVHTISIVGEGALGINLTKVKSENNQNAFLKTKEGKALMSKVQKAKSLEAEQAESPVEDVIETPEAEVAVEDVVEQSADVSPEAEAVEPEAEESPVEEAVEAPEVVVEEEAEVEAVVEEAPVEKAKSVEEVAEPEVVVEEAVVEAEVGEETPEEVPAVEAVDEVVVEEEGEVVEKAKAYTSGELIQLQKDALDGVHTLVKKLQEAVPDANLWEVTDLVYSAIWKIEDAIYSAESSHWSDIYDEVYAEVNGRVEKAKALQVQESGDLSSKLKALAKLDPELAVMMQAQLDDSKAKALAAENDSKAMVRAKALEQGAVEYKRIATEDNPTEDIVDAMIKIEEGLPEAHAVVAKALSTASAITMAGDLFKDTGTSNTAILLSEEEFVEGRAKTLVDEKGGNLAAARATVRQTEEYAAQYS